MNYHLKLMKLLLK